MRVVLCILVFLFSLASAQPTPASATEDAETSVYEVAFAHSPPLIFHKDDGTEGVYPDVLRAVFEKELGLRLKFVDRPWKRSQLEVQLGRADLMVTVPTEARLKYVAVTDIPIFVLERRVYASPNHPRLKEMANIRSVTDLVAADFTASTNFGDGWYSSNVASRGIVTQYVPDLINSFMLAADQRYDIVIATNFTANSIMDFKKLHTQIVDTGGRLESTGTYIMVSKRSPLLLKMAEINEAIAKIAEKGQLQAIASHHFNVQHADNEQLGP